MVQYEHFKQRTIVVVPSNRFSAIELLQPSGWYHPHQRHLPHPLFGNFVDVLKFFVDNTPTHAGKA